VIQIQNTVISPSEVPLGTVHKGKSPSGFKPLTEAHFPIGRLTASELSPQACNLSRQGGSRDASASAQQRPWPSDSLGPHELPLIEGLAAAGEARVLPEEAGGGHGGGLTSAHRGPRSLCPGSARLCCQAAIFSACFGRQLLSVRTIDIPGPSLSTAHCPRCLIGPNRSDSTDSRIKNLDFFYDVIFSRDFLEKFKCSACGFELWRERDVASAAVLICMASGNNEGCSPDNEINFDEWCECTRRRFNISVLRIPTLHFKLKLSKD
jgi:hypothetical protein